MCVCVTTNRGRMGWVLWTTTILLEIPQIFLHRRRRFFFLFRARHPRSLRSKYYFLSSLSTSLMLVKFISRKRREQIKVTQSISIIVDSWYVNPMETRVRVVTKTLCVPFARIQWYADSRCATFKLQKKQLRDTSTKVRALSEHDSSFSIDNDCEWMRIILTSARSQWHYVTSHTNNVYPHPQHGPYSTCCTWNVLRTKVANKNACFRPLESFEWKFIELIHHCQSVMRLTCTLDEWHVCSFAQLWWPCVGTRHFELVLISIRTVLFSTVCQRVWRANVYKPNSLGNCKTANAN